MVELLLTISRNLSSFKKWKVEVRPEEGSPRLNVAGKC